MSTKHAPSKNSNGLSRVRHSAADIAGAAGHRLTSVMKNGRQLATRVRGKAVAVAKATDKSIHANPYKAVGMAVGIGALLGFFLARRRASQRFAEQD